MKKSLLAVPVALACAPGLWAANIAASAPRAVVSPILGLAPLPALALIRPSLGESSGVGLRSALPSLKSMAPVPAAMAAPVPGEPAPNPASAGQIASLNEAIAEALKPFNDLLTSAKFSFTNVVTNDQRAVEVGFNADYGKKGPKDTLTLSVKDFNYSYPTAAGAQPKTKGAVSLGLNLRNVMSQDQINALGGQADRLIKDVIQRYSRDYGQAAAVDAKILRQEADAQGNLTAIELAIDASVDLSKLPASKKIEDVPLTGLKVKAAVTLKGIEISFEAVSNPQARAFARDQTGLKEALDKLLAKDPEAMRKIVSLIKFINDFAASETQGRRLF